MAHSNIVPPLLLTVVTVAGAAGFLWADRRGASLGRWLTKPLASAAFFAAALAVGSGAVPWGRWIVAALLFCVAGDVLLLPRATFVAGLGSFLVGHLLFGAAFWARGVAPWATAATALVLLIPGVLVGRWLLPHVPAKMRAPVMAYMTAISLMVALAVGSAVRHPSALVLVGAIAFYLSDLSVARNRFVQPGFVNRLWGIPLYYAAVLLLAWSPAV